MPAERLVETDPLAKRVLERRSGSCDGVWDYQRNAVLVSATGCIDPGFDDKTAPSVDVSARISSGMLAGDIHVGVE